MSSGKSLEDRVSELVIEGSMRNMRDMAAFDQKRKLFIEKLMTSGVSAEEIDLFINLGYLRLRHLARLEGERAKLVQECLFADAESHIRGLSGKREWEDIKRKYTKIV